MNDFELFKRYNYKQNIYNNKLPIDYRLQYRKFPEWIILLHGTYNCNLKCVYCENQELRKHYGNLIISEDIVRQVVNKLGPNIKIITWHGGESLLLPENILKIPYEERKKNHFFYQISLQTNGILLNEEKVKLLKQYDINIGTSFDGIYNDNSRGKLSTEAMLKIINNKDQKDIASNFISVYTKENINILIKNYEYYKQLNIDEFQSAIVRENVAEGDNPFLVDNNIAINEILNYIKYWIYDINSPILDRWVGRQIKRTLGIVNTCEDINCIGGWLIIDPLGNITTCGHIGTESNFCNINDISSYQDLLNHPKYQQIFQKQIKLIMNKCRNCQWVDVCYGGCMGLNYEKNSNYEELNKRQCDFNQKLLIGIYELIKDIDIEDKKYNPIFIDLLKECNYISLSKIKERESRFNLLFNIREKGDGQ